VRDHARRTYLWWRTPWLSGGVISSASRSKNKEAKWNESITAFAILDIVVQE
jgi:hypothetical protein